MGNAIEQRFAESLRFLGELDLGGEMFARLKLRRQATDGDRDDEVGREGERIFKLCDMQGEERRNKEEIPGESAQCTPPAKRVRD